MGFVKIERADNAKELQAIIDSIDEDKMIYVERGDYDDPRWPKWVHIMSYDDVLEYEKSGGLWEYVWPENYYHQELDALEGVNIQTVRVSRGDNTPIDEIEIHF